MRLIDVLEEIFSSNLKTKFALKGGTAINAFYANLPRLSVDIDIDYLGSSREEMIRDKHAIDEYLQMALFQKGYSLSPNTRQYFALNSYMFQYTNSSGNKDVIKIDMNFLDRLHIFPLQERKISILGYQGEVPVTILDRRELYGSKLAALISRCKPRDVYDIYMLSQSKEPIDGESLRKTLIFYNCVGGDADVLNYDGKILSKLSRRDFDRMLRPMLPKNNYFDWQAAVLEVENYLKDIIKPTPEEVEFIRDFKNKNYNPEKLFDAKIAIGLKNHPMAEWKCH